jgi:hypothetical protein
MRDDGIEEPALSRRSRMREVTGSYKELAIEGRPDVLRLKGATGAGRV